MMSRRAKAAFYAAAGPLMWLNARIYRAVRAPRSGSPRVQLGPGRRKYLPGWINVDANCLTAKCDVWADLRHPLPFHSNTLAAVYSHHVVEHLPDLAMHAREVYRCLEPGGVYRLGGPHGDNAISRFQARDRAWFPEFPDARSSLGGRFENFVFCRREHVTILTLSYLEEVLTSVGFVNLRTCLPTRETGYPEHFTACLALEYEDDFLYPHTLIVEAEKPRPQSARWVPAPHFARRARRSLPED